MSQKKLSNTSNLTPSEPLKKTASAPRIVIVAGLLALVVIFIVAGLMFWWRDSTTNVQIGISSIQAEVADDERERQKGLSDKSHLADNHGMLFVFAHDAQWAIWMKDMKISLDIVWLDADKKVVHIEHNVKPESYPAHFSPPQNARYVLEVASGVAEKTGIAVGAVAQFAVPSATK